MANVAKLTQIQPSAVDQGANQPLEPQGIASSATTPESRRDGTFQPLMGDEENL